MRLAADNSCQFFSAPFPPDNQDQAINIPIEPPSAQEAGAVRASFGRDMILVTPGITPAGVAAADQKRTMTPAAAIAAGADYLVVGRPVTQAKNPRSAAEAIIAEIAAVQS